MSTSRHVNKICVTAIAVSFVLALLFLNGASLGIVSAGRSMGYEDRLFDTSFVHTVDIVMDDWDGFIETCESEEYSPCAVVIDGESYKNVGIRAKGNTSLSSVRSMGSQRYSFKLEFDQYESGKTYHGLDKLSLNNLIQDNTMMKDYLVYRMMGDFGVDAPLCSYVYITVNGEDWGLYLAVEGVEDGFLQRNYGSDGGELYKPDSMSFGGGRGNGKGFDFGDFDFDGADFGGLPQGGGDGGGDGTGQGSDAAWPQAPGSGTFPGEGFTAPPDGNLPSGGDAQQGGDAPFGGTLPQVPGGADGIFGGGFGGMGSDDVKLKYIDDDADSYSNIFDNAKTKVTNADKQRLIASIKSLNAYTDLESTLDTDEVLRYFVMHNFVCNGDSYTGAMIHNYYLHEQDGQLSMIPWDYNLAFGTFQGGDADSSVNASIDSPVSGGSVDDRPMLGWIFSDEVYEQKYHELFSEFIERWFSDGQLAQLIGETRVMLQPYVEKDPTKFCTMEEFDTGVQTIEKFVTLRSEAVERQLSGDDTGVDTAGLNLSDMGTMNGAKGGFDRGNGKGNGNEDGFKRGNPGTNPESAEADDGKSAASGTSSSDIRGSGNAPQRPDTQQGGASPWGGFGSSDAQQGGASPWEGFGTSAAQGGASPWGGFGSGARQGGEAGSVWILLGGSVLVLLGGLFAAIKIRQ